MSHIGVMPAFDMRVLRTEWRLRPGYESIASSRPQLEALAECAEQHGAMSHLDVVLKSPYPESRRVSPFYHVNAFTKRLMRGSQEPALLTRATGPDTGAAVLLFEYKICGIATTVFVPVDGDGWRTVVAAPGMRLRAAYEAAAMLLSHRANVVLISYTHHKPDLDLEELGSRPDLCSSLKLLASRSRGVRRVLPLLETYHDTLACMGPHTRRNLRAARRRLTQDLAVRYVPSADPSFEQYMNLNLQSRFPLPDWIANWRYDSVRGASYGFLGGLITSAGDWLSLVGGRRHRNELYVDWQLNRDDLRSLSLGTAIRAWIIEDEIHRGTRSIRFEGGTSHSMQSGFKQEFSHDLLFARPTVDPKYLNFIRRFLPRGGKLEQFLAAPETIWHVEGRASSHQ